MDDNQQTSASQNSSEQSGQTTQQVTPVVVDFSILRPDPTDTSHFSTRSQNNADMQTKTSSKDE